jgi:hypothetical protein
MNTSFSEVAKSFYHLPTEIRMISMSTRLEFLKEQIEEMRRAKLKDSEEQIGEVAEASPQIPWAKNPAEVLLNTVLAMRQR